MNDKVVIAKIKMLQAGIVPAMTGKQLQDMFESMSEEEKRLAKRKFRKVWRKLARKNSDVSSVLQLGNRVPDDNLIRSRAALVSINFVKNISKEDLF